MPKIKVLPEFLANQIAAGEIVERPASVAKELIENSLDAGAHRLQIEAKEGGKQLLRIRDDGEGMGRDDALLAFEHHATSKIRCTEDLASIHTLGFRGEALPAIASVSRTTLRSLAAGPGNPGPALGTEVRIHGGVMQSCKEIAWSRGTEVLVEGLFFNIPARRKFLKTVDTEFQNLLRLITHYTLCNPEVSFSFQHNQRTVFAYESTENHEERIYQVLGSDLLARLIPIQGEYNGYRLFGFAGKPHEQRRHPYSQYIYVNRRMVRDRFISRAVMDAYGNALSPGSYPIMVLFLSVPFSDVDVNVHPAKTEVRFHRQEWVRELVHGTLVEAFRKTVSVSGYFYQKSSLREEISPTTVEKSEIIQTASLFPVPSQGDHTAWYPPPEMRTPKEIREESGPAYTETESSDQDPFSHLTRGEFHAGKEDQEPVSRLPLAGEKELQLRQDQAPSLATGLWRVVGQLFQTYILATDGDGLLLFDQHVAHERILYEKVLSRMEGKGLTCQRLLYPITMELTPAEKSRLPDIRQALDRAGFEAEEFGGNTIIVKAVPAILAEKDCLRFIREILELAGREIKESSWDDHCRRMASAIACKAAIKANMPLSPDGMQMLIDALRRTNCPHTCPHGRPILFKLERKDIEKRFQR